MHLLVKTVLICIYMVSSYVVVNCLQREIKIGALLGGNDWQHERILNTVVDELNSSQQKQRQHDDTLQLVAKVERVLYNDSYDADKKACGLLSSGVVAMLGPADGPASQHVQAICDSLEVPFVETQPNLSLRRADLSINLYPSYDVLASAYIDLIRAWNWTSFVIVYETGDAIIRLQDVLKDQSAIQSSSLSSSPSPSVSSSSSSSSSSNVVNLQQSVVTTSRPIISTNNAKSKKWTVKLFQFQPGMSYREMFWQIKRTGETNIVLDVKRQNLYECLKHAQQVGLMSEKHNYLITSLDLQTVDLEDFMFGKTKITAFQMTDSNSATMQRVVERLNQQFIHQQQRQRAIDSIKIKPSSLFVQTALIYDAVQLLTKAIKELEGGNQLISGQSLSCDSTDETWQYGSSLINYMRSLSIEGLTGLVSFDQTGRRSSISLNIMSLTSDGLQNIGKWNENAPVRLDINPSLFAKYFIDETDTIDTLVVTAKRTKPYFMLKSTSSKQEGNDQYEGYAVDLIHELSQIANFKYKFKEVDDGKYGVGELQPNKTQIWNGMIGEIISGRADLAISDLTITSSREEAVDFTLPFMNTGISILFKKPANKVTTLFSFLSPFSLDVWLYVLAAYTGVSLELYVVGCISPYEWTNPYPCHQEETVMQNRFSVLNSFWFTIGSLMQQGTDLTPKSMATRAMASIWYFFTLIMISSYTANLAAFLTVEKVVYPIENAKDLSEQTEIKYGSIGSGTTRTFFRDSQIETYRKIFKFMEEHNTYVKSNEEGKDKVEQGNFAFFMESTSIEYITERNCNLTQIGSLLDSKGYGIALSKTPRYKRPYRNLLSSGILRLQETGMLHVLKNRWWKEKDGVSSCSDEGKGGGVTELSLANVGGVFVVLLGGMAIAFVIALIESFSYRMNRKRRMDRDSMCDQMMTDLVFALSCQSSTKPAKTVKRRVHPEISMTDSE